MEQLPVLYTPAQAAAVLGLTESSVRRYIRDGEMAGIRINARGDWRVTAEAINAFVAAREALSGQQKKHTEAP